MSSFLIWCLKRFFVISVQLQRFTKSLLPRMAPTTVIMRSFIIHKAPAGLDGYCLALTEATKTFQSTRPSRASTAIFTNFFQFFFIFLFIILHFSHSTFLSHPKIPIFYTTFPAFSSANIQAFPCPIHIRTKKSTVLLHQIQALLLYAPPYFYIGSPDNKISGCLYLYQ